MEATQETIIDQQQTIEKFRDLVHNLNADMAEYRSKGERSGEGPGNTQSQAAMMNINVQMKSAIKTQSRVSENGAKIILGALEISPPTPYETFSQD